MLQRKLSYFFLLFLIACQPRLGAVAPDAPWIQVARAGTYPRFEVTDIVYLNDSQSGGNVNVYVSVLDEQSRPALGARVRFNTSDGENEAVQAVLNGTTDFPQSHDSCFFPDRGERGPYYVEVAGAVSDRVSGMGLPACRHVVYQIRFQRVTSTNPTPPPVTPAPSGSCDVLPNTKIKICLP